jgi:hypothetical protein
MQWTIKLEFTPDGGETIEREIGTITRPLSDLTPEEIGLTLTEGHELLRDIERRMIGDQVHIYALLSAMPTLWSAAAIQRRAIEVRSDRVRCLSLSRASSPTVSMPG